MEKITTIHLINKDNLIAEIEKRRKTNKECMLGLKNLDYYQGKVDALSDTISFIDTLEVKEVDLEKEMNKEWNKCKPIDERMGLEIASIEHEQFDNIAKHFFEIGLKVQKGEIL